MIPRDLLSAFPHRQFHTLPGLLDSWAALPNSNPNACVPMQGGSLYHFYDGLWYDPKRDKVNMNIKKGLLVFLVLCIMSTHAFNVLIFILVIYYRMYKTLIKITEA